MSITSTIERVRAVQALMVTAEAAGASDEESSHGAADEAVYEALLLVAEHPDAPAVRKLVQEVRAFIPKALQWERWYA